MSSARDKGWLVYDPRADQAMVLVPQKQLQPPLSEVLFHYVLFENLKDLDLREQLLEFFVQRRGRAEPTPGVWAAPVGGGEPRHAHFSANENKRQAALLLVEAMVGDFSTGPWDRIQHHCCYGYHAVVGGKGQSAPLAVELFETVLWDVFRAAERHGLDLREALSLPNQRSLDAGDQDDRPVDGVLLLSRTLSRTHDCLRVKAPSMVLGSLNRLLERDVFQMWELGIDESRAGDDLRRRVVQSLIDLISRTIDSDGEVWLMKLERGPCG